MSVESRFAEVEWIARTEDVGVRVNTLAPGQATAWHFHRFVADHTFALEAPARVELRGPDEAVTLAPGQRVVVAPGRVHRVVNPSPERPLPYLLVQATGPYDFNVVDDPRAP
jgi:quercetin dioxygenase-like cupin family protein